MSNPHGDLVTRFYEAFAQRDARAMRACYHPEVHFQDEAFNLYGARAGAMWHMLCARSKDLELTFSDVQADDQSGSARWIAKYSFSQTGRQVRNVIDASFTFEDGLIRTHRDRFDFWTWSRQALGAPGLLLGWTPWLRSKISMQATRALDAYTKKHPEALLP